MSFLLSVSNVEVIEYVTFFCAQFFVEGTVCMEIEDVFWRIAYWFVETAYKILGSHLEVQQFIFFYFSYLCAYLFVEWQ